MSITTELVGATNTQGAQGFGAVSSRSGRQKSIATVGGRLGFKPSRRDEVYTARASASRQTRAGRHVRRPRPLVWLALAADAAFGAAAQPWPQRANQDRRAIKRTRQFRRGRPHHGPVHAGKARRPACGENKAGHSRPDGAKRPPSQAAPTATRVLPAGKRARIDHRAGDPAGRHVRPLGRLRADQPC